MDQDLVKAISASLEWSDDEQDPGAVAAQLFVEHKPDDVVEVLKHLSQDIQSQLGDRLAEWADYKSEGFHEHSEFLNKNADYLDWKASAHAKKNVINAVLRKAKKLRWELGHEKGSDERAAKEGYVKGARVSHDLGEGDVGTVVEIHGRSVWIAWDEYPNLPVQYASPWHFSLIDTFSEEGLNG